jgi:hypothetical protein
MSDLGNLIHTYRVDSGRRIGLGVALTTVGAVITAIAVLIIRLYVASFDGGTPSRLPGIVLLVGLVPLVVGLLRLVQAASRPGERFEIYENGFAHVTARRARAVRWADVLDVRETGRLDESGIRHTLGLDYRCVVRLRDGTKIRFNTMTDDAPVLASTINLERFVADDRPEGA